MERIAGLDEVGFELVQHPLPAARRQRQAIIERARHDAAADSADVARQQLRGVAGNEQRVRQAGLAGVPVVLGVEVSTHATAGGE